MIEKNQIKEDVKNDPNKMPERNPLEKGDLDKTKEEQMLNKFAHRANKEETYNPKRTEVPTADNFREGDKNGISE